MNNVNFAGVLDTGLIGVIGAGVMGRGVAESAVEHGLRAILIDLNEIILQQAISGIRASLRARALQSRELKIQPLMERITVSLDYKSLKSAHLIIENALEDLDVKRRIYELLDDFIHPDAVIAVNTSTFPISEIAGFSAHPQRVVGVHFMNPVPSKALVELIPGRETAPGAVQTVQNFLARIDKRGIIVGDAPGFVTNRVLMLTINEAIRVVGSGIATAQEVDEIFVGCFGQVMGPIATADLIGLDTILLSLESLKTHLSDSKFEAAPLLRQMVESNLLGRKTGIGFFSYRF